MTKAQSLWLTEKGRAEVRRTVLPPLGEDDLLIESRFGAISRGTERLVANGAVPPTEYDRMRAPFQEGTFPFPVKYGYAVVGGVAAGVAERLGQTVFCLYPHQDRFTIPASMAIPVPQRVPAARAVLAANMETALNGTWDAAVAAGDRVAVVGGGLVGLLVAYLCAGMPGTNVTVIDVNPDRRVLAAALGCAFTTPDDIAALAGSSDIVIHASASPQGLTTSIALAGFEAKIVEMSWYGDRGIEVPLGGAFHSQRLSIVASQVGHVPADRRARWPLSRRLAIALDLLADDRLDVLISGETDFEDLAAAYCGILANADTLCHRIRYRSS